MSDTFSASKPFFLIVNAGTFAPPIIHLGACAYRSQQGKIAAEMAAIRCVALIMQSGRTDACAHVHTGAKIHTGLASSSMHPGLSSGIVIWSRLCPNTLCRIHAGYLAGWIVLDYISLWDRPIR